MTVDIAFWNPNQHRQIACDDRHFVIVENDAKRWELPIGERVPCDQPSVEVRVDPESGTLSLTNHGHEELSEVFSGLRLAPGTTAVFSRRCLLGMPHRHVELWARERTGSDDIPAHAILCERSGGVAIPTTWSGRAPSSQTLASWFHGLGVLQRAAASSPEFYALAARSIVRPGGLDRGMVLLQTGDRLRIVASAQDNPSLGLTYRHALVERAILGGQTLISDTRHSDHVFDQDPVVVAPIFGRGDRAVGAVYGVRSLRAGNQRFAIRPFEALWLQLVAEAVGAGIQRLAAESNAARTRLMFEQVFSIPLVDELLRNPEILRPQQREITVLFCDLRDSTGLSRILSPEQMYQLLSDVLEQLTRQVTESGGVIIDYYGDGLAAMWNAPHDQADHALRACRAAVNMIDQIDELSAKYRARIGRPLRLGVGLHTDLAYVGNSGSRQRLKYGPRGSMVSLASRLENVTKIIRPRVVISRNTHRKVDRQARTRFLGKALLPGICEPVEIYELQAIDLECHLRHAIGTA